MLCAQTKTGEDGVLTEYLPYFRVILARESENLLGSDVSRLEQNMESNSSLRSSSPGP